MTNSKHPETVAIHAGREPSKNFGAVNPPVYHVSTILFDNYADFKKAETGTFNGTAYGRHGMKPARLLEEAIAELEGADKALLTSSGLNAIAITLHALLKPGDHALIVDSAYSPTRIFCEQELKPRGVEITYYDPLIGAGISKLIQKNTKLVFTESPGSLTFEIQDIPAIVKAAHKAGAIVALDNTWATPFFFRAFDHGVDVSIHSATKYLGGHSDFLLGIINCTKAIYPAIKRSYKNFGINVGPDDINLAQRGLRTLHTRLKHHEKSALEIATWLEKNPKVSRVLHPALKSHPGHKIWKRDFTGASGVFSFVLKKNLSEKELAAKLDSLSYFKLGYSWGGYESLIIPVNAKHIRTATRWAPEGSVFRVSIGLENVDDLKADLEKLL